MTETYAEARASIGRLKALLRDADEDTRWMFGFWLAGLFMMGGAIIGVFGWNGAMFCLGIVIWKASGRAAEK